MQKVIGQDMKKYILFGLSMLIASSVSVSLSAQDFDDDEEELPTEDGPSVFTRDGHKFMVNSDLMAGGAEPVHAKSAYDAGNPSFFTDAKKLTFSLIGLFALITAEFIGLVLLLK